LSELRRGRHGGGQRLYFRTAWACSYCCPCPGNDDNSNSDSRRHATPTESKSSAAGEGAGPTGSGGITVIGTAADDPGRDKLVREARTKMMIGGESMEQVTAFLKVKGFNPAEAMELAFGFHKERVSVVRSNGVKKAIVRLVLMAVPVILYFVYKSAGRFSIRRSIWAYIMGVGGAYMFVSGLIMIVAPKSEKGAVVKE
jgi:predicted XRE-type DNA-binding protein